MDRDKSPHLSKRHVQPEAMKRFSMALPTGSYATCFESLDSMRQFQRSKRLRNGMRESTACRRGPGTSVVPIRPRPVSLSPMQAGDFETQSKGNSMLVISRKAREGVKCVIDGREMVVSVVAIRDGKVRLGFSADKSIRVLRSELVTDEEQAAAKRKQLLGRRA